MTTGRRHGWYPYLLPYGGFLVLVEIQGRLPADWAAYFLPIKVLVPFLLFLGYAVRGAYPELRGFRALARGLPLDVGVGLGIALLWVAPYALLEFLPRPAPEEAFDPQAMGKELASYRLGMRFLGFACVTPFVEELFVRSFLIRYVDVFDRKVDFRDVPMARFAWRSFLVTAVWFTLSHVPWEWAVALPTGILFNLWLYHRGHIVAPIVAHAVANAAIWVGVVYGPVDWIFL